jgi:hypothetical protein
LVFTRVQLNPITALTSEAQSLRDIKLYIPIDAELVSLNSGKNTLVYQGEPDYRNGSYESHCRGVSCAEFELNLNLIIQLQLK